MKPPIRIPREIGILGHRYKIKLKKKIRVDGNLVFGTCSRDRIIQVTNDEELIETLFHELGHAANRELHARLSHSAVHNMGMAWLQIFQQIHFIEKEVKKCKKLILTKKNQKNQKKNQKRKNQTKKIGLPKRSK